MKSFFKNLILGLAFGLIPSPRGRACNVGEGTHDVALSKTTDAAFTLRHLLCKKGVDADHIDVCGAADEPYGTVPDEPGSGDLAAVKLLGKGPTTLMIPTGVVTQGADVFTDAAGKVQAEPTVAGTYWLVGRSLTTGVADKPMEVADCQPVRVVVLALLGNVNSEIGALTSSSTTTQAEFNALRDKCEELADDVRAMARLGGSPALLKVLDA